jgi:hypothetical protein
MSTFVTHPSDDTDDGNNHVATDLDDDIAEFNEAIKLVDAKHSKLLRALRARDKTVQRLLTRDRLEVNSYREMVLQANDRVTKANRRRDRMKKLLDNTRRDKTGLKAQIDVMNAKLQHVQRLHCDICTDYVKDRVTKCGHGFCKVCIGTWFDQKRSDFGSDLAPNVLDALVRVPCPTCRKMLKPYEVWKVYLDNGHENGTQSDVEDEEVTGSDEDSEVGGEGGDANDLLIELDD